MRILFKKTHPNGRLPVRKHDTDTGYDVYAAETVVIPGRSSRVVPTGIQFAYIEPGYWVRVASRSGLGFKYDLICFPGVIDESYRGDAGIKLFNLGDNDYIVEEGERIAQFVVHKRQDVEILWSEVVQETDRGSNGFGSTGKK